MRPRENTIDLEEFLARPLVAHLATTSEVGPRESPLWFLWEDGHLWLVGTTQDGFPKRIRADGRCALGIVDFDLARGVLHHVGMRGRATVVPLNRERLHRLLARYLGSDANTWNPWFKQEVIDRLDLMIRFEPQSIVARDQSYFK